MPKHLLRASSDNPSGYWESPAIIRFNDNLLSQLNSSWKNPLPITPDQFREKIMAPQQFAARWLIEQEFGTSPVFAMKDPRLCLLLPFWKSILYRDDFDIHIVFIIRDPDMVARSLAMRSSKADQRELGIDSPKTSLELWLRYNSDAELWSQELKRYVIVYEDFVTDWHTTLKPLLERPDFPLGVPDTNRIADIQDFMKRGTQSHTLPNSIWDPWQRDLGPRIRELRKIKSDIVCKFHKPTKSL